MKQYEIIKLLDNKEQSPKVNPNIKMPIRTVPYKHQIAAFNFALNIYADKSKGVAYLSWI